MAGRRVAGDRLRSMFVVVTLLRLAKFEARHEKWLNDRHWAERLRTAMFTALVGRTTTLIATSSPGVFPSSQGPEGWFIEPFVFFLFVQAVAVEEAMCRTRGETTGCSIMVVEHDASKSSNGHGSFVGINAALEDLFDHVDVAPALEGHLAGALVLGEPEVHNLGDAGK
jgi:hypothetical protein